MIMVILGGILVTKVIILLDFLMILLLLQLEKEKSQNLFLNKKTPQNAGF
jgi:hypothetical protein